MKLAAYQAPLLPAGSMAPLDQLARKIRWCEAQAIDLLCCPEAILGGLADDAEIPANLAIRVDSGQLAAMLAPLASATVTSIIGFTEATEAGALYNSAAIFAKGEITGIYRKRYPAVRHSIYHPGEGPAVFDACGARIGLMICNDSNFPELAVSLAAGGAEIIFIPSNNALRPAIADVVAAARGVDGALARANGVPIVRADVTGRTVDRVAFGSSAITDAGGTIRIAAEAFAETILVSALADLR